MALCRQTRKAGGVCRWESERARRVNGCGRPSQTAIVLVTANVFLVGHLPITMGMCDAEQKRMEGVR